MVEQVYATVSPLLERAGFDLVDIEVNATRVAITVDRPEGIDLDSLSSITKVVSGALDSLDIMTHRYELEVSSPGLERRLRTPTHFLSAVGERVSLLVSPAPASKRRVVGKLISSDVDGVVVEPDDMSGLVKLAFTDIERARTVFEWGPSPAQSPSRGSKRARNSKDAKKEKEIKTASAAEGVHETDSVARSTTPSSALDPSEGAAVSDAMLDKSAKTERVTTS